MTNKHLKPLYYSTTPIWKDCSLEMFGEDDQRAISQLLAKWQSAIDDTPVKGLIVPRVTAEFIETREGTSIDFYVITLDVCAVMPKQGRFHRLANTFNRSSKQEYYHGQDVYWSLKQIETCKIYGKFTPCYWG